MDEAFTDRTAQLLTHPMIGRPGRVESTRERRQYRSGHRTILNGILCCMHTCVKWRDLPERYKPGGRRCTVAFITRSGLAAAVSAPSCCVVTDCRGLPLAVDLSAGHVHESLYVVPVLSAVRIRQPRGIPARAPRRPPIFRATMLDGSSNELPHDIFSRRDHELSRAPVVELTDSPPPHPWRVATHVRSIRSLSVRSVPPSAP